MIITIEGVRGEGKSTIASIIQKNLLAIQGTARPLVMGGIYEEGSDPEPPNLEGIIRIWVRNPK